MDTAGPDRDGGHVFAEASVRSPADRRHDGGGGGGGVGGADASQSSRNLDTWVYFSVLMINWFHRRCRDEKHVIPFQNGEQTNVVH